MLPSCGAGIFHSRSVFGAESPWHISATMQTESKACWKLLTGWHQHLVLHCAALWPQPEQAIVKVGLGAAGRTHSLLPSSQVKTLRACIVLCIAGTSSGSLTLTFSIFHKLWHVYQNRKINWVFLSCNIKSPEIFLEEIRYVSLEYVQFSIIHWSPSHKVTEICKHRICGFPPQSEAPMCKQL